MAEEGASFREAIRYSHLGLTMVAIGGIFFWGGLKLDDYFGSSPWGMLGGLFLGIVAGMLYFAGQIRRLGQKLREDEDRRGEEDGEEDAGV